MGGPTGLAGCRSLRGEPGRFQQTVNWPEPSRAVIHRTTNHFRYWIDHENGISNMARPRVESTLFPSWTELPVEWNNLDVFQHVNNTHFIRWFESARVAYLQQCKLDSWMHDEGMGPIISSIICHYRRPVLFPDTVRIGARVKHLGRSNMVLYHAIFSIQTKQIVADGESHVVLFDRNRSRPVRISDSSRELIEKFEATAVEICKVDL